MEDRPRVAVQQAGDPAAGGAFAGGLRTLGDFALADVGRTLPLFRRGRKVWQKINPSDHHAKDLVKEKMSAAKLEEKKVSGAVKTDFILSAEIMTIVLNALPQDGPIWMTALSLAIAGVIITIAVYGSVAVIVKADDVGLHMAARGESGVIPATGRFIVKAMPVFLQVLVVVGTAAMVWVGGSIIMHGLDVLGWPFPYDTIHAISVAVAGAVGTFEGAVQWFVTAFLDGVIGLILGFAMIPIVTRMISPLVAAIRPASSDAT